MVEYSQVREVVGWNRDTGVMGEALVALIVFVRRLMCVIPDEFSRDVLRRRRTSMLSFS